MGNREPTVLSEETALVAQRLRALRDAPVEGISRRTLLRRSLGLGIALWLGEVTAGSLTFLWNSASGGGGRVRVGTIEQVAALGPGLLFLDGFPVYAQAARAFIVLVDPKAANFVQGRDEQGDGRLNVRALSQRCPHLGCRPNPCIEDFWFHCPCHQSRYDRLGTKVDGVRYGPAARSMDRFGTRLDKDGVLFVDQTKLTLGPLPVALGMPGVIPPLVENGCA